MYVHIFGYLVNKLETWWVYLSLIENVEAFMTGLPMSVRHNPEAEAIMIPIYPSVKLPFQDWKNIFVRKQQRQK